MTEHFLWWTSDTDHNPGCHHCDMLSQSWHQVYLFNFRVPVCHPCVAVMPVFHIMDVRSGAVVYSYIVYACCKAYFISTFQPGRHMAIRTFSRYVGLHAMGTFWLICFGCLCYYFVTLPRRQVMRVIAEDLSLLFRDYHSKWQHAWYWWLYYFSFSSSERQVAGFVIYVDYLILWCAMLYFCTSLSHHTATLSWSFSLEQCICF